MEKDGKYSKLPSLILALAIVAVWGVTFISTKKLLITGLLPSQIFFIRFIMAYAGIGIFCLCKSSSRRLFSKNFKDELIFIFLGMMGGSLYFMTENSALEYTQASNVSFIVCSAPLITILLTLAWKKIFPTGRFSDALEDVRIGGGLLFGTLLAIAGMAMVFFDGVKFQLSLRGDILAFLAALTWGLYSVFMGRMTSEYGTLFATRKVFFYGLVTIIPFLVGKPFPTEVFSQPGVIGNLLFLGIVASLMCFALWNVVLVRLGNVTATNFVYLNPFFTLVAAMIFLGERLTAVAAIGCLAIVIGVFLATSPAVGRK